MILCCCSVCEWDSGMEDGVIGVWNDGLLLDDVTSLVKWDGPPDD